MALIDRLAGVGTGESNQKLAVNAFHSLLYELSQGQVTRQQIIDYFNLTGFDIDELDFIIAQYNAQPNANAKARFVELIRVIFILAEAQVPGYTTNAEIVARINAI